MPLTPAKIQHIQRQVIHWQASHGRHDLPWQHNVSAYRVHVSEIMLQQTQVTTVIPYFERWMQDFPSLSALAAASEDDVMAHWQGLGYYSRARNLRKAAAHLADEHNGEYPNDLKALNAIPGVGQYTAGAIRSFAFNDYGPIVDGNVKRLYARLFAIDGEPNSSAFNKIMWQYANSLTPEASGAFSQGVLDLGATVCKKSQPLCQACPLQSDCLALKQQRIAELPNPKKRKIKPVKDAHFVWHTDSADQLLLIKRPSPGIWGGLWCLPQHDEVPANSELVGEFTHQFTHYTLNAQVWRAAADQVNEGLVENGKRMAEFRLQSVHELSAVGLPTPIRHFIENVIALRQPTNN
ncbi:MAG: A/G-specific adenine glycosylase [Idiomarina sp.]|nr:A/G-specific adenine glycosylase [Idiomarina sp.]